MSCQGAVLWETGDGSSDTLHAKCQRNRPLDIVCLLKCQKNRPLDTALTPLMAFTITVLTVPICSRAFNLCVFRVYFNSDCS